MEDSLKYTPDYPKWYYSYIEIDHINYLQKELINIKNLGLPHRRSNPHYINVYSDSIEKKNKFFLNEFLSKVGLYKDFQRILFSTYTTDQTVAHVDGYTASSKCYQAINIPLIDCEESYTCFYTTDKDQLEFNKDTVSDYAWLPLNELKETARVEVIRPMIVNTTILHAAQIKNKTRTIASIRFNKRLTYDDMINLGIKQPFVQVD